MMITSFCHKLRNNLAYLNQKRSAITARDALESEKFAKKDSIGDFDVNYRRHYHITLHLGTLVLRYC